MAILQRLNILLHNYLTYIYAIYLLFYLHYGHDIMELTPLGIKKSTEFASKGSYNQVIKITAPIVFLIGFVTQLLGLINQTKRVSWNGLAFAAVVISSAFSYWFIYDREYSIFSRILIPFYILSSSGVTCIQFHLYCDIMKYYKLFTATNNRNDMINLRKYIKKKNLILYVLKTNLKWIVLIVYNVLFNIYCFGYLRDKCSVKDTYSPAFIKWIILAQIPYHLLPSDIKYDVYNSKIAMRNMIIMINIFLFVIGAIWILNLHQYLDDIWQDSIWYTLCCIVTGADMLSHFYFQRRKQKKIESICEEVLWTNYIKSKVRYYDFIQFLIKIHSPQNLLFFVEWMQCKNIIIQSLGINHNIDNTGYLLDINCNNMSFAVSNVADSIMHESMVCDDIECIRRYMITVYNKYFVNEEMLPLNISFVSINNIQKVKSRLIEQNNIQIINIFDDVMIEIATMMNLLYKEYQIEKHSLRP